MTSLERTIHQAIKQRDAEFTEQQTPARSASHLAFGQQVILATFVFTILMLVLMSQAQIDIVVSARGEVLLERDVEKVQHLEGGLLEELMVNVGDIVYQGQPIAVITSLDRTTQLSSTELEIVNLRLELEKYQSLLEGRQADFANIPFVSDEQQHFYHSLWFAEHTKNQSNEQLLRHDIRHKTALLASMKARMVSSNQQLGLIQEQLTIKTTLYEEEMASYLEVLNMRVQEMNMLREMENLKESIANEQFGLDKLSIQLRDLINNRNAEYSAQLATLTKELSLKQQQIPQLSDKVERLTVLSPVDGVIDKINYNYRSAVISPGDSVADISPLNNRLHGEAKIPRKDLGFVEVGQNVKVKLDTYNFAKFGAINGTIYAISRTTYEEKEEEFFIAKIAFDSTALVKQGIEYPLSPHMEFTADIKTGDRRVIDYAVKPVMSAIQDAFDER